MNDMTMIDMHCHTVWSDGKNTASELIVHAKKIWLEALFITDHDRVSLDHVWKIREAWLTTVPSVEITTVDPDRLGAKGKEVHMTYYAQKYNDDILWVLETKRSEKKAFISEYVAYIRSQWFDIDDGDYYGTYYIAAALASRASNRHRLLSLGIQWNESEIRRELYKRLISKNGEYYKAFTAERGGDFFIPRLSDIAEMTREEQWILSFAHPNFTYQRPGRTQFLEWYRDFYQPQLWISAIEINSLAPESWADAILDLDNTQLTFWSDCHQVGVPDEKHANLGTKNQFITEERVQREFWEFRNTLWI